MKIHSKLSICVAYFMSAIWWIFGVWMVAKFLGDLKIVWAIAWLLAMALSKQAFNIAKKWSRQ